MVKTTTFTLASAVAMIVGLGEPANAQNAQPFSLQLSAISLQPAGGNASDSLGSGVGGELQFRLNFTAFSLGLGLQRTLHGRNEPDRRTLTGIFLEPRYVLPIGSNQIAVYSSARLAAFRETTLDEGSQQVSEVTGFQGNVGGGVLIRATRSVNVDLGLTAGYLQLGDRTVGYQGDPFTFQLPGGNGTNVVFRMGIALGIGARR